MKVARENSFQVYGFNYYINEWKNGLRNLHNCNTSYLELQHFFSATIAWRHNQIKSNWTGSSFSLMFRFVDKNLKSYSRVFRWDCNMKYLADFAYLSHFFSGFGLYDLIKTSYEFQSFISAHLPALFVNKISNADWATDHGLLYRSLVTRQNHLVTKAKHAQEQKC